MKNWKEEVENLIEKEENKVVNISLLDFTIEYDKRIKSSRLIKTLNGDEEIVRAYIINYLINKLKYSEGNIELEKEYKILAGHKKNKPRIDVLVKDNEGNPFFFIEVKAPDKYEADKNEIEGQLFALAEAEERDFKTKVRYLVYYTLDFLGGNFYDRSIIIDYEKYDSYADWEAGGYPSISSELVAGYGELKKQPFIKGSDECDLRVRIEKKEIESLGRNLHNVLWGGGGTTDSEIFYSLVNIILAKIQDEYEKENGQEYEFQVYKYGDNIENANKLFERINGLYKRALKEQLFITEQEKIDDDSVINRNKFPLNKLIYTVQSLESFSLLEGRSYLDGKDILGSLFETITRDGFKQNKGQFFTPVNIVNFILYALKIDELAIYKLNTERELPYIIDPSAGSGTFLVEAMRLITKEVKYKQFSKIKSSKQIKRRYEELFEPDYDENRWAKDYLYGIEINSDLGTSSKVNMILHGDGSTNIFVKDGLLPFSSYKRGEETNCLENSISDILYYGKEVNGKFDVIISNPPFSVSLDSQTQIDVKNSYLFGLRKSENLFIERYYQLLNEKGRLGVILPESVFDTGENKYIRLFLFKYFNIKAIVSLPQLTFEPYTPTKTSILFAQKKTKEEIIKWNEAWDDYGKRWSYLKTRVNDYISYYIKKENLNSKWAEDVIKDIEENNYDSMLNNIYEFLHTYFFDEDKCLSIENLLIKYKDELETLLKYDKEFDIFGYYNAWWVFSMMVTNHEFNTRVFMTEAENVGYKRTKRGERVMPNDLFSLEYAPNELNVDEILDNLKEDIKDKENKCTRLIKETDKSKKDKLIELIIKKKEDLVQLKDFCNKYYNNGKLREEYKERTDKDLINMFKNGLLCEYISTDIVIRVENKETILDVIRQEIEWA